VQLFPNTFDPVQTNSLVAPEDPPIWVQAIRRIPLCAILWALGEVRGTWNAMY